MADGLLLADEPAVEQLLHHRVVAGEAVDLLAADGIGAAVADVADVEHPIVEQDRHAGGPRPLSVVRGAPEGVDAPARLLDGFHEHRARVGGAGGLAHHLEDGADRDVARLLAPVVAAHPVTDHEEVSVGGLGVAAGVLVDPLGRIEARIRRLTEFDLDAARRHEPGSTPNAP